MHSGGPPAFGACEGGPCPVELTVKDRAGEPVMGLTGLLLASRRQGGPASRSRSALGVYRQLVPLPTDGLWDFAVTARRGDDQFLTTTRREVAR